MAGFPDNDEALTQDEKRYLRVLRFAFGLPAVVIAVAAISAVLFGNETPKSRLVSDYLAAAETAVQDERLAEADLFYRKVVSLAPFDLDYQYNLAATAEQMKDARRAWALMSRIAPDDKVGHGPAHHWQAIRLYEVAKKPKPPADLASRLEHHLLATIKVFEKHDQAHMMLGQLYLTQAHRNSDAGLLEKSLFHLSEGVESYPETRLSIAELHRRLGNGDQAKREAMACLAYYQQKLEADANDIDARLRVGLAHSFLLQFGSAIEVLRQGMALSDDPRLRKSLAGAYLSAARVVDLQPKKDVAGQLELLQQALQLDPENELILSSFAAITADSDPAAEAAREALHDILAEGKAPAMVHLILGSIAMQRGQDKQATYHLNQALELNPQMPEVLNNLAWHLAFSEPPQLARALELADRAVELRPQNIEIRDTRGQILLKLGRHQEALKELLIVVRQFPERTQIHESLAEIYEHLGDAAMAQRHRQRAKSAESE